VSKINFGFYLCDYELVISAVLSMKIKHLIFDLFLVNCV
jgi:hypothetical protein